MSNLTLEDITRIQKVLDEQDVPTEDRWKIRSATYQGIADAMADQWGNLK